MTAPVSLTASRDASACCACGATRARPARDRHVVKNVCYYCWNKFKKQFGHDRITAAPAKAIENGFNEWLSDYLLAALKAKEKYGFFAKCEAVSESSHGYQCTQSATRIRDGRKICGNHARKRTVMFFDVENPADPFDLILQMATRVFIADTRLAEIFSKALATSKTGDFSSVAGNGRDWMYV